MTLFARPLTGSTARVAGVALVAALLAAPTTAFATVYGLESTEGAGSAAPTQLFKFEENGSAVTVIADVTVGGGAIDADALAQSAIHGLLAYRLIGTSSQLISINSTTGAATHIGSALAGREMRAAAFDALGRLWVVDAANNVLLRIDPATGAVLGSAVPLMLGMSAFTITSDGSDIAFAANGTAVLVDSNSVYSLNTVTGAVALLFQDSALQADMSPVFHVGAAFVASLGGGKLFVFDVNGTDDVFFYQNLSTPRVLYDEDFSSSFNAGRGDLASLPAFVVLDVDANGAVQPLTDGLLVLRHLFGFTDSTLIGGALGAGCSRCVAADITSYLNGIAAQLNIDGNPSLTPLTDGLLVLRYKFGFTDTTLTNGAVGPSCTRCDATTIVPYLDCEDLPMFLRSRFDADVEGWTHTGATSMTFGAAGGNPGGYLHIDNSEGPLTFIFAPATFEGDLSALNGGTLAFDGNMLDTGGLDYNNPFEDYGNVRITGGGTSARADLVPGNHTGNGVGNPPKNQWTTFSIGLSAASFGVSPATWSQILADVTEVRLSVEALFGAEVQGVDNFTMAAPGDLCTPMP